MVCRFSRVDRVENSSVVMDLPKWGIPKIISLFYLACSPKHKKDGVSCMFVLKEML